MSNQTTKTHATPSCILQAIEWRLCLQVVGVQQQGTMVMTKVYSIPGSGVPDWPSLALSGRLSCLHRRCVGDSSCLSDSPLDDFLSTFLTAFFAQLPFGLPSDWPQDLMICSVSAPRRERRLLQTESLLHRLALTQFVLLYQFQLIIYFQPMHRVLQCLHWEIAFEKCFEYTLLIIMTYF